MTPTFRDIFPVSAYGVWSPDGTLIHNRNGVVTSFDVTTGSSRVLANLSNAGFDISHRAPLGDGFISIECSDFSQSGQDCSVWNAEFASGALQRRLMVKAHLLHEFRGWITQPGSNRVATTSHGKAFLIHVFDPNTYKQGFAKIDMATGAATDILLEQAAYGPPPIGDYIDLSSSSDALLANGHIIIYQAQSHYFPPEIYAFDLARPFQRPLGLTGLAGPSTRSRSSAQLLTWRSPAGKVTHGALFLPSDASPSHKVPLVVWEYPGVPASSTLTIYRTSHTYPVQVDALTDRGIGVFVPDMPLSIIGDDRKQFTDEILQAVDAAVATNVVDGTHLGLAGYSYGGGTVNKIVTATHRFAAAVALAGMSDEAYFHLASGYLNSMDSANPSLQESMGGGPWDNPQRYIDNSPIYWLNQVTTPLLLLHGDSDGNILYGNAVMMYNGLSYLGKPVTLVTYKGMNHGPSNSGWSPTKQQNTAADMSARILDWFSHYLKGTPLRYVSASK